MARDYTGGNEAAGSAASRERERQLPISIENLVPDSSRFRILLVGPRRPLRRSLRNMLQSLGFTNFREAGDGDEALCKLRADRFGLVVSERLLPIRDGYGLFCKTWEELADDAPPFLLVRDNDDRTEQPHDPRLKLMTHPFGLPDLEEALVLLLFHNLSSSPVDRLIQAAGRAMAEGDPVRAHRELDDAEHLAPRSPMVAYFRQLTFRAQGREAEAEQAVAKARRLFSANITGPRQADRHMTLGRKAIVEGRLGDARQEFQAAFAQDQENRQRRIEAGEAFLRQGAADDAAFLFESVLEDEPDNVFLYNRLGMAFRKQRQFAKAVAVFRKAISIDPFEANLRYNLARVHLVAGDRALGVEVLEKAIEDFPDFEEARTLLASLIETKGAC